MGILTSLTRKYLSLNKKRTIVTIIGIMLSCALICSVATMINSFQQFFINITIENTGPQHAVLENISINNIKYVEQNSCIKESYKTKDIGYALLEGNQNPNKPFLSITAYDDNAFTNNKIKLISGRLPKNSNEVVISNELKTDGGITYKVGDKISLRLGQRMLGSEVITEASYPITDENGNKETFQYQYTKEYTVVGIIEKPKYQPYYLPGYQAITYLDKTLIASTDTLDLSVIDKNPKKAYTDLNEISKNLKISGPNYNDDLLRWYGVTDDNDTNKVLYTIGAVLIIVIMIASIIVIHNSFNISITERKKQFGMLASVGTTTKQLRNMVLKEGLILSLIGIPLGILLSIIGIGITLMVVNHLDIFAGYYESKLELVINSLSIIVTIGFGGLTIFLSSLIPALKTSHISPIDAIRLSDDIKIKGKKLKISKSTRKLFGIEGELGLKNMKRSKKKYRSTIISIFVSVVLFMTVSAFANYSFKSAINVYNDYNYNVRLYQNDGINDNIAKTTALYNEIAQRDDVKSSSIVRNIYAKAYFDKEDLNPKIVANTSFDDQKQQYYIYVILSTVGDKEFKHYLKENNLNLKDYTDVNNPQAVIIKSSNYIDMVNKRIYDLALTKLKTNDHIDLYYDTENDVKFGNTIEVGSISNLYPVGFGGSDRATSIIQGFISNDVFDSLNNDMKSDNIMYIDSSNATKLSKEVGLLAKQKGVNINVDNIEETTKQLNNVILTINIFLYGFIVLISLITVTNVINTITTSIYLRRREFATLKAVGMTNKEFNRMLRFENIYYGVKSLLFALPFGILIDYFFYKSIDRVFVYDYQFPLKAVLVCVISVAIIITITMIYSIKKIKNDNIIDAIKQENI